MSIDYEAIDELMLEKMSRKELIAEIKHLQAEQGEYESKFSDLRARLEAANQDKKRYWDAINRQYQRNIGVIGEMEKAQQERDDLRRQVTALRGALEWYADLANYHGGNRSKILDDGGEKATQSLTASGENRYSRVMEAAKALLHEVRQFSPRQSPTTIDAADKLAAALGECEK